jgi:hypothetical protein
MYNREHECMMGVNTMRFQLAIFLVFYSLLASRVSAQDEAAGRERSAADANRLPSWLQTGTFSWTSSEPLLWADPALLPRSPESPWLAVKDPTVVRFDDRWHLFCSLRKQKSGNGRIRIGYVSFDDWESAHQARWSVLDLTLGYHGAPQIFFFEPEQTWYLIYQAEDASRGLAYGPCYSTNRDIADPDSWTRPEPLYQVPPGQKAGLDFWVICDRQHAFLFFTTLNGKMWQAQTALDQFPNRGWSEPRVVLESDIFEASHTYKLTGIDQYLTLIEAQDGRKRRYYKAFVADSLDGAWKPLAASREQPFASTANVKPPRDAWTDSYSHGELIRSGINQRLEVAPARLQFLFQGASADEYQKSGDYGSIPWKLGILELQTD